MSQHEYNIIIDALLRFVYCMLELETISVCWLQSINQSVFSINCIIERWLRVQRVRSRLGVILVDWILDDCSYNESSKRLKESHKTKTIFCLEKTAERLEGFFAIMNIASISCLLSMLLRNSFFLNLLDRWIG